MITRKIWQLYRRCFEIVDFISLNAYYYICVCVYRERDGARGVGESDIFSYFGRKPVEIKYV